MDVSLDVLRTFAAVYRTGSLVHAAEQLCLAQPTVASHVAALEEALGRRLFEYRARGVEPTPEADDLALRVTPSLETLRGALSGHPVELGLSRAVHLGGSGELVSSVVMPGLADLIGEGLRLHVTLGEPRDLLNTLRAGRLDLVVAAERPPPRGVRTEPAGEEVFVLVAAPQWARRLRAPLRRGQDPASLETAPLISCAEDHHAVRRYWQHVFGRRPGRSADLVVPDPHAVRAAVVAGAGMAVLPRYLCARELECNTLRPLCEPDPPPSRPIFLSRREGTAPYSALELVRSRILRQGRLR